MNRIIEAFYPGSHEEDWSAWTAPDDIELTDIPHAAVVYQLGSVDEQNAPVSFAMVDTHTKRDLLDVDGVVYIGMAVTARDRYWKFVQSWKTDATVDEHGCRSDKYDSDPAMQELYPIERMRTRSKVVVHHEQSGTVDEEIRNALIPEDTQRRTPNEELEQNAGLSTNPRTDYTSREEARLIRRFVELFGRRPHLNRISGERPGPMPNDDFYAKHFGAAWTDNDKQEDGERDAIDPTDGPTPPSANE